ncbi:MAG: hypothetical protein RIB32_03290 [Phycisphaerales bacterium]
MRYTRRITYRTLLASAVLGGAMSGGCGTTESESRLDVNLSGRAGAAAVLSSPELARYDAATGRLPHDGFEYGRRDVELGYATDHTSAWTPHWPLRRPLERPVRFNRWEQ